MNCLAAFCRNGAEYDVLVVGDWWWPECAEHTAAMREGMAGMVHAVETHNSARPGQLAARDS